LKLAEYRTTSPLFDAGMYTRGLEAAYAAMLTRYRAGLPPAPIDLAEAP
jgi:predicted O-linked N-acetylglucosamine transferase (SPINDLY family)